MVKIKEYCKKITALPGCKIIPILLLLGLLLLFGGKYITENKDTETAITSTKTTTHTEQEKKLAEILSQMEGVGEVEVVINTKDKTSSVLILAEGADNPEIYMKIKQAVRTVMQTDSRNIKIEKKKS